MLVAKLTTFTECPCLPLAFLLHDRKFEVTHTDFFTRLRSKIPVTSNVVIVTDGESAMHKAVANVLPSWKAVSCSNHILTDVEVWLKKRHANCGEIAAYKCQIQEILHCESKHQLKIKMDTVMPAWSEAFVTYYNKYLLPELSWHSRVT